MKNKKDHSQHFEAIEKFICSFSNLESGILNFVKDEYTHPQVGIKCITFYNGKTNSSFKIWRNGLVIGKFNVDKYICARAKGRRGTQSLSGSICTLVFKANFTKEECKKIISEANIKNQIVIKMKSQMDKLV